MKKKKAQNEQRLKHLPFFEVLAEAPEDSDAAKLATAGLLALRMIDHWVLAGPAIVEPESVSVRSVRGAIMALSPSEPVREALLTAVNTMQLLRLPDLVPVLPRVYAYGQILERHHGQLKLAADVYESVVRLADAEYDTELVLNGYTRLAFCQRKAGALDDAEASSRALVKLAQKRGNRAFAIWGKMGVAQVAMLRGDLTLADSQMETIAAEAQQYDLTPQLAAALHNQSVVAYHARNPARASVLAHRALKLTTDLVERDRVLGDLAAYLTASGEYTAALDAFRILEATASSEELRVGAIGNILITAARMQDRQLFDATMARLSLSSLSASARLSLQVEVAAGFRRFGEPDEADRWLREARDTAARFALPADLAHESRAQPVARGVVERASDSAESDATLEVAADLRQLAATLCG